MSDWIEKNNGHILEGFGNKFVVCSVLYSKQLPPKWEIKQSPFLFDVNKRFATLDKAKAYCEDRYKELNGQRDEITRLRADLAAVTAERDRMREALRLVISDIIDYERANKLYPNPGKQHCWQSVRDALVLLEGVTEPASPWRDIESAPRDGTPDIVR